MYQFFFIFFKSLHDPVLGLRFYIVAINQKTLWEAQYMVQHSYIDRKIALPGHDFKKFQYLIQQHGLFVIILSLLPISEFMLVEFQRSI